MKLTQVILFAVILFSASSYSYAQKGMGNKTGIARNNVTNATRKISGKLVKILNEPCTNTTGQYARGLHLIIKQNDQDVERLNIHLGPTSEMSEITEHLKPGQQLELKVFKTNELPDDQYIAKSFTSTHGTYELRNDQLRPFWAGNNRGRRQRW
jgi:hypothetical protein